VQAQDLPTRSQRLKPGLHGIYGDRVRNFSTRSGRRTYKSRAGNRACSIPAWGSEEFQIFLARFKMLDSKPAHDLNTSSSLSTFRRLSWECPRGESIPANTDCLRPDQWPAGRSVKSVAGLGGW